MIYEKRISSHIDIISSGSEGTEPSVLLTIQQHSKYSQDIQILGKYLFNCSEGTQRLLQEAKINLSNLNNIFLTKFDSKIYAGIPGIILGLSSIGSPSLNIIGLAGTSKFMKNVQTRFIKRDYPVVSVIEPTIVNDVENPVENNFTDKNVTIECIELNFNEQNKTKSICSFCNSIDILEKSKVKNKSSSLSVKKSLKSLSNEESENKVWLKNFYEKKDPTKIPYLNTILSKYDGRFYQLKEDLSKKYGNFSTEISDDENNINRINENEKIKSLENQLRNKRKAVNPTVTMDTNKEHQCESKSKKIQSEETPSKKKKIDEFCIPYVEKCKDENLDSTDVEIPVHIISSQAEEPPQNQSDEDKAVLCFKIKLRDKSSPVIWIIECPTSKHIPLLKSYNAFRGCLYHPAALMIHFCPLNVIKQSSYAEWLFSTTTKETLHIFFDGVVLQELSASLPSNFESSRQLHERLRRSMPNVFPVISHYERSTNISTYMTNHFLSLRFKTFLNKDIPNVVRCYLAKPRLHIACSHPYKNEELNRCPSFTVKNQKSIYINEGNSIEKKQLDIYPRILMLGTGCAAPSKLRGNSGMLIEVDHTTSMLVECGENTYGQLFRVFGQQKAVDKNLLSLKCIWISHSHADHQAGLLRLLQAYIYALKRNESEFFGTCLTVIGPKMVINYVRDTLCLFVPLAYCNKYLVFLSCARFKSGQHPNDLKNDTRLNSLYSCISSLKCIPVIHCYDSFGLIIVLNNGMKIVYSGDTRPSETLVTEGYGADVLVHEATFDDEKLQDAIVKKHTTVGEAISVSIQMEAKYLVLTHFSQRYPVLHSFGMMNRGVIFAHDLMYIYLNPKDLKKLEQSMRIMTSLMVTNHRPSPK